MILDLSLVVLTNNRPARCRDSVLHNAAALAGRRAEIVIINNGDPALDLPDVVAGAPCRVFHMPYNVGAEARNVALLQARGRNLLFLDDDAYVESAHILAMEQAFSSDPATAAAAFRITSPQGVEEAALLPTVFHGCACAIRRPALEAVGGYPRRYLYYGEEYDLAFRLYQARAHIRLCLDPPPVIHARDPAGRSKDHIVRLLMRNNTYLWTAFAPAAHWLDAMRDTLQRYIRVARKENAGRGYLQGLVQVPVALLRGVRRRRPLSNALFARISLEQGVTAAVAGLRPARGGAAILCGVGRFPGLWVRALRRAGWSVAAFWDRNPCWHRAVVHGVPVHVTGGTLPDHGPRDLFLVGTASLADTRWWLGQLESGIGPGLSPGRRSALAAAKLADRGCPILGDYCRISVV